MSYFTENFYQYISDAAVTLESGNQFLVDTGRELTLEEKMKVDFLHGAVGLATEIGEMFPIDKMDRTNFREEIGDCFWYLSIFDRALVEKKFVFEFSKFQTSMFIEEAHPLLFESAVKDLLDLCKKNFIYGKPYEMVKIYNVVISIHAAFNRICEFYGFTAEECRNINILKLKARYGDKFSAHAALNRNLSAERAVLEGNAQ